MKKFICGLLVGGIVSVGVQISAWNGKSTELQALNQIGEVLEKIYSKQKSIDERLTKIQKDVDWMERNSR